jgi:hypothetical protein
MTGLIEQCAMGIAGLLEPCAVEVREAGRDRWKFELPGEVSLAVTAWRNKEWLWLRAALARSTKRLAPELLDRLVRQNRELVGGAKFTLADDPPRLYVSAEIPMDEEDADLGPRLAAVCEAFRQAAESLAAGQRAADANPAAAQIAGGEAPSRALDRERLALCEATGWPLSRRAGDQVAIELDAPGLFCQATAEPKGERGLQLGFDLASVPPSGDAGRHALNVFLLHASHVVRMARATARTVGGATVYGWEVSLDRVAGAGEVQHALSALSVACRLSVREIQALEQDETTARSYLMLRGWCS